MEGTERFRSKNTQNFWPLKGCIIPDKFKVGQLISFDLKTGENGEYSWKVTMINTFGSCKFFLIMVESIKDVVEVEFKCLLNTRRDIIFNFIMHKDEEHPLFSLKHQEIARINGIDFHIKVSDPVHSFANRISQFPKKTLMDYEKLLGNEIYSDLKFITTNGIIFAHKAVLATRSPVFAKMLSSNTKEKPIEEIELPIDRNVLEEMLRFIYTGQMKDIDNCIEELIELSYKYALDDMRTICENTLYKNLNNKTAIATLKLSYKHNIAELKRITTQYIIELGKRIIHTSEFIQLMESDTDMALDIFKLFVPKDDKIDEKSENVNILKTPEEDYMVESD